MSIKSISRADAITRIKYILALVKSEDIEELEATLDFGELNTLQVDFMLGQVMDGPLFRFSISDKYIIEN